jgi:glioma pathogenesis-related protein 2
MSRIILQRKFQLEALERHNFYRAKHNVPLLEIEPKLCDIALEWVEQLASKRDMEYSSKNFKDEPVGENILRINNLGELKMDYYGGDKVTDVWYEEEEPKYKYDGLFTPQTGHFTQVSS